MFCCGFCPVCVCLGAPGGKYTGQPKCWAGGSGQTVHPAVLVLYVCCCVACCDSCCAACVSVGAPGGKNKGQPKQNLFLIYLDALSVVNSKRAYKGVAQQQQQPQSQAQGDQQQQQLLEQQLLLTRDLSAAAPNMPDFTLKDLQFILTFTGEIPLFCILLLLAWHSAFVYAMWGLPLLCVLHALCCLWHDTLHCSCHVNMSPACLRRMFASRGKAGTPNYRMQRHP